MRTYERDPILGNSLILDYQLNEGVGIYMYDLSQAKMVGTGVSFVAGTWAELSNGRVPLMTLDLDGIADEVTLGTNAIFDQIAASNAMTLEVAFLSDVGVSEAIFGGFISGVGGAPCYPQLLVNATKLEFRPTQDTGETSIVASDTVVTGSLYHAVVSYAESDKVARMLINGGEVEDKSVTLVCTNDTLQTLGVLNAYIGCRWSVLGGATANFFDGHIVLMRMWYRRLSDFEQKLLFRSARVVLGV